MWCWPIPLTEQDNRRPVESEVESINMIHYLPVSSERLKDIQRATELDRELQTLKNVILQGWPEVKGQAELSVQNGVIFRGERVIVPTAVRSEIMQRIHYSHIGTEGCLRKACDCVYWPGMNAHLRTYMAQCSTCTAAERNIEATRSTKASLGKK